MSGAAETTVVRRGGALRVLGRRVDALEASGDASGSRVLQLRMVVGMWRRALGAWPAAAPVPGPGVADLFEPPVLEVFWALAVSGVLRAREQDSGRVLPVATQRIVRDCLGILAEQVVPGRAVALPEVPRQAPKRTVPKRQLRVMYRELVDLAAAGPLEREGTGLSVEDRARLLAMVAVVLDTGARSGELEAHRLSDLGEDEVSLRSVRRPQNGTRLPVQEVVWPLSEGTSVAVRRWLIVREGLVEDVQGAKDALWVSLKANQYQQERGLPLQAKGIGLAYGRGARALNWVMAGQRGWQPLPHVLERLTRTVRAELGEVPRRSPRPARGSGIPGPARVPLSQEEADAVRAMIADPKTTVDEIAAAARTSLTSLYRWFPEIRERPGSRSRV